MRPTPNALVALALLAASPATAAPILATDLLVRRDTPALEYRWTAPPHMALEPKLFRSLELEGQKWLWREDASATSAKADAAKNGFPFNRYSWSQTWQPEAETPQLLALSSTVYAYSGGAHGNLHYVGAIFDRKAQRQVRFAELFTDPKAAFAILTPAFCQALDAERVKKRGAEKLELFSDCPKLESYPIVPMGDGSIRQFRALVPPYEAGPWSEGSYEITLEAAPVAALIKPQYRLSFAKP
jgi:Deacetylase PdaC